MLETTVRQAQKPKSIPLFDGCRELCDTHPP
jgi:hypothetical protein